MMTHSAQSRPHAKCLASVLPHGRNIVNSYFTDLIITEFTLIS